MSIDKLVDSTQLDACCTAEANAIRAKTGGSSQIAYDWANSKGFADAIAAIPSGGGITPPQNALAQFEVETTVDTQPTTLKLNLSSIIAVLGSNRTYTYSLILWRDDAVAATTMEYTDTAFVILGRLGRTSIDTNTANEARSNASSATTEVNLNVTGFVSSKRFSNGTLTITLAHTTTTDRTGKYKGMFTVIPPWTKVFTGTPITDCPDGFLTFE